MVKVDNILVTMLPNEKKCQIRDQRPRKLHWAQFLEKSKNFQKCGHIPY